MVIRSQFEQQLQRVRADLLRIAALVEGSCSLAHEALIKRDLVAADKIAPRDEEIDRLYRQVTSDCMTILSLQAPVATDLRFLTSLLHISRDLERIGDYAVEIGQFSTKLFAHPPAPYLPRIETMFNRCQTMLAMSLTALTEMDTEAGQLLLERDDAVDADYESVYNSLCHQSYSPGTIEPNLLLLLTVRNLERIADHAANIGRRVNYIVTGEPLIISKP
ncbi:phosphate signaling complex protein PhoU [Candidatus Synechococcus calcipolaris G9]|uniref:Phosphate-specific transport system accessory protein PhoU n=1 Tax=Candidatus Synechococcus calcipolaris G9 TaxID=1497997 RepID=A0ABT6F3E0_9SYNE|nr:phosphate signaling complex protein PhoU [Candidatus Synechococcus calcipolaris]MDG2992339.1 phosphate signaling complex protein PhoU [Candidatus Synechococcus calcipolaris G9]